LDWQNFPVIATAGKRSIADWMLGAALLEPEIYEEAALVRSVRTQAVLVVIMSSMAAGVGMVSAGAIGLVLGCIAGLVGWGMYAFVAFRTATERFGVPRTSTVWGATWRTLALANSPRVFLILTLVPGIGFLIGVAVHSWVLIATVFAVRSAMDLDARPAVVTAVAGWLPMLALWALVAALV
jgi:hypothetical protein